MEVNEQSHYSDSDVSGIISDNDDPTNPAPILKTPPCRSAIKNLDNLEELPEQINQILIASTDTSRKLSPNYKLSALDMLHR